MQGPLLDGGRRGVLAEGRQDGDAGGELLRRGRTQAADAGVAVQAAKRQTVAGPAVFQNQAPRYQIIRIDESDGNLT